MLGEYLKRMVRYVLKGQPEIIVRPSIFTIQSGKTLKNKVVLITGGNKGLGFSIAKKCISEEAHVILVGRDVNSLKSACDELGEQAKWLQYDISDSDHCRDLLESAEKISGKEITTLVNSAGVSFHEGSFKFVTQDGWDRQFQINLKGTYFLTKAFAEYCTEKRIQNAGVVILSSERGLYGDDIPYGLTKAALNSFIKGMARRVLMQDIRINGIAPGVTATEMTGVKKDDNLYREASCGKRVFLPEEVAEVGAFLISDASKCITGEIIACNQGNHLRSDW